jgi:hypothetical protein
VRNVKYEREKGEARSEKREARSDLGREET